MSETKRSAKRARKFTTVISSLEVASVEPRFEMKFADHLLATVEQARSLLLARIAVMLEYCARNRWIEIQDERTGARHRLRPGSLKVANGTLCIKTASPTLRVVREGE